MERIEVSRNDKVTKNWKKFINKVFSEIDKTRVFNAHREFFENILAVD